jgi:hypothetical protein
MGAAAPQSELFRHSTHWPGASRHRGAPAGQLLFCVHCTHCCVVESQIAAPPPQSEDELQPTHAPLLQRGAFFGQPAPDVQVV